jgi:hypothetical protein
MFRAQFRSKTTLAIRARCLNIADAHNSLALLQLLVCEINSNVTMKSCRERETRTFRDRFPGIHTEFILWLGLYLCRPLLFGRAGKVAADADACWRDDTEPLRIGFPDDLCVCARNVHLYMNRIRETSGGEGGEKTRRHPDGVAAHTNRIRHAIIALSLSHSREREK